MGKSRKKSDQLEAFPLFYEELGQHRSDVTLDQPKKESSFGIDEKQLAELTEDLRSPIKPDRSTNPMQ